LGVLISLRSGQFRTTFGSPKYIDFSLINLHSDLMTYFVTLRSHCIAVNIVEESQIIQFSWRKFSNDVVISVLGL